MPKWVLLLAVGLSFPACEPNQGPASDTSGEIGGLDLEELVRLILFWVFIDGAVLGDSQPVLNHLDIDEIEAVEIYRSPHVPREYWSPRGQPCAAMAFWTRR